MSRDVQVDMPFASDGEPPPNAMRAAADERNKGMEDAAESMERLRLMQGELERKHAELAEIGKKQDAYQAAKRDILLRLERAQVAMAKQAVDAAKAHETIEETCKMFQARIDALNGIDETGWGGEGFEEALNRAFGLVEEAETVFARGSGRVEALALGEFVSATAVSQPHAASTAPISVEPALPKRFTFWLKAGFAFTLPLVVAILLLSYLILYLNGY